MTDRELAEELLAALVRLTDYLVATSKADDTWATNEATKAIAAITKARGKLAVT